MSVLHRFSEDLGGTNLSGPPFKISASKLDGNFRACSPIPSDGESGVRVTQTKDGWKIELASGSASSSDPGYGNGITGLSTNSTFEEL
jgi:hypothetical protein